MNQITGVLTLGAAACTVALVVARLTPAARPLLERLHPWRMWCAFVVAGAATAGSLWYSESAEFTPCKFCWLQRIFMYSLAVVLLVGAIRRDRNAVFYAVPLAAIGLVISIYHNLLEHNPTWESKECATTVPCAVPYFKTWGWLTLAGMALVGFVTVLALLLLPTATSTASTGASTADRTPDGDIG